MELQTFKEAYMLIIMGLIFIFSDEVNELIKVSFRDFNGRGFKSMVIHLNRHFFAYLLEDSSKRTKLKKTYLKFLPSSAKGLSLPVIPATKNCFFSESLIPMINGF